MKLLSGLSTKPRVLLISPPYRLTAESMPLGPMYIAAVLEKAGCVIEVIDMDVRNLPPAQYLREIQDRNFDYFFIGGMISAWNFIVYSINAVKALKPSAKVIVGGGIVTGSPSSLFSVCKPDVGVLGEGEATVLEVLDAYESHRSLDRIPGIIFERDGKLVTTPQRDPNDDLDQLPFPAWDLFDFKNTYSLTPTPRSLLGAQRGATVCTTRGCPFQCTFCFTRKQVRQRSVQNIMAEIEVLYNKYGIRYITLSDDLFVVRREKAVEFCNAIIKSKMRIGWSAAGRANLLDKDFLKLCKAAGCELMGFGIESGSSRMLKGMKKNQTPEQIIDSIRMISEAGIKPDGSFIIGMPGECPETVAETLDLYKKLNTYRKYTNAFFFATPYPGTELFRQMRAKGRITDEIPFFENLSEKGDAVQFLVNCTDAFSDEELIRAKKQIETDVFRDLIKQYPFHAFLQYLSGDTTWGRLRNLLLEFKMKGWRAGLRFLSTKLAAKVFKSKGGQGPKWDRIWNRKRTLNDDLKLVETI